MHNILLAELRRSWTILWRYPLQAVSGMLLTLMIFLGMLAGVRYVAGPTAQFGHRLDSVLVGYLLWNALVFAMGEIAAGLQGEARIGTLEQLYITSAGGTRIFLARAIAGQTVVLVLTVGILGILLLSTGTGLRFPPELFLPLITALATCYGLGFMLGSFALLFKRIGPLVQMAQFGLLALVMLPFETWHADAANPYYLLPLVPGAALLRDLMARGLALNPAIFGVAVANACFYLTLGVLVFQWAERQTKRRGLLGTY